MEKVDILGVFVHRIRAHEIRDLCSQWLSQEGSLRQVATVNPEFVMEARVNNQFRDVLNAAALALADGIGIFFASWVLHGWKNRLFRITGVDFVWLLAELCAKKGEGIYLIGAGEGVAQKASGVLRAKYPALIIAGAETGIPKVITKTSALFDEQLCEKICAARPSVLLVAFGAPRQDVWIAENAHRLPGVRIAVGVGGTFDYLAGIVPYAPHWIRGIGFEWTYRLMTQPYRWRRILTAVIRFPLAVLKKIITR